MWTGQNGQTTSQTTQKHYASSHGYRRRRGIIKSTGDKTSWECGEVSEWCSPTLVCCSLLVYVWTEIKTSDQCVTVLLQYAHSFKRVSVHFHLNTSTILTGIGIKRFIQGSTLIKTLWIQTIFTVLAVAHCGLKYCNNRIMHSCKTVSNAAQLSFPPSISHHWHVKPVMQISCFVPAWRQLSFASCA